VTNLSIRVYAFVTSLMSDLKNREEGQDLLEYVLLGGLIAAAIVALVIIFNPYLNNMAANIGRCLDFDSATNCNPGF
jgi:Flp pilus assembly pilin Flp